MNPKALARVKFFDRAASVVITLGGMLVVAAVLGILILVLSVALPLFFPATVTPLVDLPSGDSLRPPILAVGVGQYMETAYEIDETGTVTMHVLPLGEVSETHTIPRPEGANTVVYSAGIGPIGDFALTWDNGAMSLIRVKILPEFNEEGTRRVTRSVESLGTFGPVSLHSTVLSIGRVSEDDAWTRVTLTASGALQVDQVRVSAGFLDEGERTPYTQTIDDVTQGDITAIAMDTEGNTLYVGSNEGYLGRWDLREPGSARRLNHFRIRQERTSITSLAMIFGDVSVAVADSTGSLSTWFNVTTEDGGGSDLREIHVFPDQPTEVTEIVPARHAKVFFTKDAEGGLRGWHMTAERELLTVPVDGGAALLGLSARGNGLAVLSNDGVLSAWTMDAPHPETNFKTLFGPVWYENYPEPSLTWQSSSGSDDFEPKMSMVPLIFGSFKGTVYAMIFAVPLALFGAVYTSQFAANSIRGTIKSAIEIMAAIPSVVIGFLAALWFAPILDNVVLPVLFAGIVFPIVLIVFVIAWRPIRETSFAKWVGRGHEFMVVTPVLLLAGGIALVSGHVAENLFFDSNFKQWLFDSSGQVYDQRNSIVIAFALGFAVVPLIFTIAEDAISNVPFGLRAASLALGASRWQTVWRVVLPSASPGIFAGMIIGFGRAVGETMIVLMATGNTPILDVSPFNGMRTLSANIAVEIPEAPVDGTLYRILFLSAVLLLILTSVLNTAAEIIRHRLRKKYGQFH